MGAVYKAYDKKLQRVVALKLLPPELRLSTGSPSSLFQEARAASALNHPHILTVYESARTMANPTIAMEYVEGETLRQRFARALLPVCGDFRECHTDRGSLARLMRRASFHRDT